MRMNGPRTRAKVCQTIGSPRPKLLAIASISPLAPSRSWSSPSTHAASASIAAMATPGGTGCASPWETRGASRKWRSQSQRAHSRLSQRHKGSASHSAGRCAHRLSRPQSYFPRRRSCSGCQTPARPPRELIERRERGWVQPRFKPSVVTTLVGGDTLVSRRLCRFSYDPSSQKIQESSVNPGYSGPCR